jgi:hypothetical protein
MNDIGFDTMEEFLSDLNKPVYGWRRIRIIFRYLFSKVTQGWLELKWAWQRVFRGWDDRVIWSIDYYLCEMMPQWLDALKEQKHGIPVEFTWSADDTWYYAESEWQTVLKDIKAGFSAYVKLHDVDFKWKNFADLKEKSDELQRVFERGMKLLTEHFGSLCD